MKKISLLYFAFLIANLPAIAYYEKDYQTAWCIANAGKTEVILPDKTRVDCVTKTHAIEFDFAKKWGESIGQSLYYASILEKTPGIVLIIENPEKDLKYLKRLETVADKYNIKIWTITPDFLVKN